MSKDERVKAADIDAVMARSDSILLDVREPKEIEERGAALLDENGFTVAGFCGLNDYKGAQTKPPTK